MKTQCPHCDQMIEINRATEEAVTCPTCEKNFVPKQSAPLRDKMLITNFLLAVIAGCLMVQISRYEKPIPPPNKVDVRIMGVSEYISDKQAIPVRIEQQDIDALKVQVVGALEKMDIGTNHYFYRSPAGVNAGHLQIEVAR